MPTAAPATGNATAAQSPAPSPLANPLSPSDLAPTTGAAMRAAAPPRTPFPTDCMPEDMPDMMFWGRRSDMKSFRSICAGISGERERQRGGRGGATSSRVCRHRGAHLRLGAGLSGDGRRGDTGKRYERTLGVLHHLRVRAGGSGRAAGGHGAALLRSQCPIDGDSARTRRCRTKMLKFFSKLSPSALTATEPPSTRAPSAPSTPARSPGSSSAGRSTKPPYL